MSFTERFHAKNRAKIFATEEQIKYVAGQSTLSYDDVKQVIQEALNDTLAETIYESEKQIKRVVPRATGQLMDNILLNLQSSEVTEGKRLNLTIGTNIDYAQYVDKMSTKQLRHTGQERWVNYGGERGYITLYDPLAQTGFMGKLILIARNALKKAWKTWLTYWTNAYGIQYGKVSRKIKPKVTN